MSNHTVSATDLCPSCFRVMPFGRKPVSNSRAGASAEVDFDMLWARTFGLAIDPLGCTPVRADASEHFVIAACERAIALGSNDKWVWPTLPGTAFRCGDIDKADELAYRIETDGLPAWNLATTLADPAKILQ